MNQAEGRRCVLVWLHGEEVIQPSVPISVVARGTMMSTFMTRSTIRPGERVIAPNTTMSNKASTIN